MLATERSRVRVVSDWVAEHLALLFGATTTVWFFLIVPLVILLFPKSWQNVVFYLASGWVQLWALPLLTFVANKADALRSAKADADHEAQLHIVKVVETIHGHVITIKATLAESRQTEVDGE